MDGSNLLGAGAGVAAGLPCFGRNRYHTECNYSGGSRGSSLCELLQQAGCKPVERIDFVGVNVTTVAGDHPRPQWRSIHEDGGRGRSLHQNTKLGRYERGRSLRKICDKKSIHRSGLLVFVRECTT
jgi:hypothetical protein